ncbi:hypothetical protein B0H16DRAFT_656624 [Mycena metata]|uniref:Thiaminase-2/PQQC domain-containing protein n=1 Tax=Mycena metata TaxID=1033252 RepID=A0AAD7J7L5_9AGAR|nr:hypothetical protein B0H16DRAFT_656624 [Mycena metata]
MSNHPIAPEDELVSLADAALTAAEADAAAPNSPLIFRPEWRPEPRTRSSVTQPAPATRAFSWASLVKDQLSRAGLHHDQPLPTHPASPSSTASAESPPTASATSASTTSPPSTASAASSPIPGSTAPPPQDAVAELVKRNQKAFDKVVNHPFPRALGEGTASLDGFRYYMIQDWLYLRTCTQLKFLALGSGSYGKQVEEFDVRYKVEYTNKLAETCRTMLGIPESTMEATGRSGELDASEHVYRKVLQDNNAWLGYYVVLLPCVMTYGEIAQRLVHNPSTAKNVVYHRAWTEVNYNDSSLKKYIKFVNENIAAQGGVDEWSWAFNVACLLESQLFDIGLEAPVHPYEIIPNGTYSIHTSSANNLVLAVQDVTHFLRPPAAQVLGGYLPSDTRSSVVGMEKMGGDNEKWLIFATKTGYTFKNVGTGLYLGMSTAPDRAQYRILQAVSDPYCWWVNPSSKQPDQGPSAYQIHDSLNLRYTLHAAIEALNSIASTDLSFTPITAHENSEAPCQMWSFDNYNFKQPERTQTHADDHQPTEQRPTEPAEQLREADATIKQLEAERDLLRKDLEKVRLALNVDESKIPTGIELSAMIRSLANEHESQMRYLNDDLTQTRKLLAEESARLLPLETWERKKRTYR